jgi:D-2-hydroxyacid dehydrogenase (NADP+)
MQIVLNASLGKAEILARLKKFDGLDVVWADDAAGAASALAGADALVCPDHFYSAALAEAVQTAAERLRWVQLLTAGYDNIRKLGVRPGAVVCNAGAAYAPAVATHAVALLLALQRNIPACVDNKARRAWDRGFTAKLTTPATSVVAVVGFGPIGREIARLLRAFGARVVAVTRGGRADPAADEVVRVADLHALLPRVDALVLALPLDETSRRLVGAREFALCKPTMTLVNIARGAIVDQPALAQALREGRIAGAAVDVTDPEPLPPSDPLWEAPNLIVSPHCAGSCGPVAGERLADVVERNLRLFMDGRPLEHALAF